MNIRMMYEDAVENGDVDPGAKTEREMQIALDDAGLIDYCDEEDHDTIHFQHPGSNSALRASSPANPRNLPCPTCETPNRLTPEDVSLGYHATRAPTVSSGEDTND